jgi:hypothetical protein
MAVQIPEGIPRADGSPWTTGAPGGENDAWAANQRRRDALKTGLADQPGAAVALPINVGAGFGTGPGSGGRGKWTAADR